MPATQADLPANAETETAAAAGDKLRYALKTALCLVLAFMIPMAMGWPHAQTAAMTVMLIAATGTVADSLQKGILRVLGSVVGAIIGLTLIALFPQERMAYLLAVSLVVAGCAYFYSAYQGDSTVFMLTSVVTLMVFNGGDADGAFLYGVERGFMTAFGVIVYTVVASTLWPVHAVDNTRALARTAAGHYRSAFSRLVEAATASPTHARDEAQLVALLDSDEALQAHFASIKTSSDRVATYLGEWNAVLGGYQELSAILVPALQQDWRAEPDFEQFLPNYPALLDHVKQMFEQLEVSWEGQRSQQRLAPIPVEYRARSLAGESHLTVAAVASRADLLDRLQQQLVELQMALDSLLFDEGDFQPGRQPRGKPVFVWFDQESIKTGIRSFVTFWVAAAIWIQFNPPGGFMFVTLCTVLVPLVSYTPVTPKILFILLSLGFAFALPAYVFLLPQLTHWLELGAFMFAYAFLGFYVFQGPVSIFFMLGLFTLGIQNTMNYNFDVIMLVVLTFYMLCAVLIITTHFPFTSKPERLYAHLYRRFFRACARELEIDHSTTGLRQWWCRLHSGNRSLLLARLHSWGERIDGSYFGADTPAAVKAMGQACDLLQGQLQVLSLRRWEFNQNRLIADARKRYHGGLLMELCDTLAQTAQLAASGTRISEQFENIEMKMTDIRAQLDVLREDHSRQGYNQQEQANFYVFLYQQISILQCLHNCYAAQLVIAWPQLEEHRF